MQEQPVPRRFHALRVAKVIEETHDAKSIVLDVPADLRDVFRYEAGQFLTLELEYADPRTGSSSSQVPAKIRRSYSLASSPDSDNEHKVTVKRVAGGRASNWLNDRLRVGDTLSVMPPEGRFLLNRGDAPILLFAGGSGITPVISLIKTALTRTKRTMRLLYANRDARSVIFRSELDALVARHPSRLEILHRFDDVHGFADAAAVRACISRVDVDAYICGPAPFMDTVERALLDAGVARERVHLERFLSPTDEPLPPPPPQDGLVPETIAVTLKGETHTLPYTRGKTLLRVALDAGFDAPFSCEEGFCGCCAAQLIEGEVDMAADDALSDDEKKRRVILTCQARPRGQRCRFEYLEGP